MADTIEVRRHGMALHALPFKVQSTFRRTVFEARSGREEAVAAFAAVGVTDVVLHTLDLFDLVAAGIAALEEEDRAAAEIALLGQPIQSGPAALIREVIARGRASGLDDTQLAGGILVVLESHGFVQRDPA
ncbi:hypothetical protein ACFQE0_14775 [Methylobacterium komagatae]|uniref:Uncharacterized protein n=1 Tax=Methylobacterium komagatae TaxID=374425 RepID=A0ABW2BK12_9HYPH